MASAAAEVRAMRYRRPWYWLVVLGVVALAATLFVVWNARSRISLNQSRFAAMQAVRLQSMEQAIDSYFQEAEELAVLGAHTLGGTYADVALLRKLTVATYTSHRSSSVYGLGVFYEPFAFDGRTELLSEYAHSGHKTYTAFDRFLDSNVTEVFYTGKRSDAANNYTRQTWYRHAVAYRGRVSYAGPYTEDGRSFISTILAFYHNGRVAGVMTVDTLTSWLQALMVGSVSHGDVAWLQSGISKFVILSTSALPKDTASRIVSRVKLRYSTATVYLSSDASGLFASNRRNVIVAAVLVLGIWLLAALVARLLLSRWNSTENTLALELRQARLEGEIAVANTVAAELRKAAYTDALTGLPNRAALLERIANLLGRSAGAAGYALLLIDIDRFNLVNETLGHAAGDELLRILATRLEEFAVGVDAVARLGSDEFVIIARADRAGASDLAKRALASIAQPAVLYGRAIRSHASIGIAPIDASYAKADHVLRDAGLATHEAKRRGRARSIMFDEAMRQLAAEEVELEANLRQAIDRHELVPFYQPIVNVASGEIASFEALVRWNRPGHGTVSAAAFMPFAESHALVHEIDALVLPQVARHSAALFGLFPQASVAVNLSAAELSDPDLAARIEELLAANEFPPGRLKLEITETSMMMPSDEATANLKALRAIGVQLVLDDFGTGYSSLAYLQRLPVVGLKIDRSFVEHITHDNRVAELVRNIVALSHTFSLYTVAEGVETAEQLEVLLRLGVGFAQGYLFSAAVAIGDLAQLAASMKAPAKGSGIATPG